jgi:hypothetical protein
MTQDSSRPGWAFNKFVASLESALAGDANRSVEISKRLLDKKTGGLREHDVLITWKSANRTILTAIECKDTARPVGSPVIEAFRSKCEDTGINKGVIVSKNGFSAGARSKASHYNMDCLTLAEAEAFSWISADVPLIQIKRHIDHLDMILGLNEEKLSVKTPEEPWVCYSQKGEIVSQQDLIGFAHQLIETTHPNPTQGQSNLFTIENKNSGLYIIDNDGDRYDIETVFLRAQYTVTETHGGLDLHTYAGGVWTIP